MRRPIFLSALALACAGGCGSPVNETLLTGSSAIQGGSPDTTHNFAVGVIQQANQSLAFCSGVLLAPNLVATARHCVSMLSATQIDCATSVFTGTLPASQILVTATPTIAKNSNFVRVSSIVVPPGTGVCGNDIALLILSSNIQVPQYVTPTLNPPMTDRQAYSKLVAAIGYGVDTPADTKGTSAGVRRIREGIGLVCIPNDNGVADCFSDPSIRQFISPNEFEGGDGTCEGDSGSGAYDQRSFTSGKWVAFGVLSRGGTDPEGGICVISIYSRFDSWAQLIIDAATKAATMGGYNPPAWTGLPPTMPLDSGLSSTDGAVESAPSTPHADAASAVTCLASGTICVADNACCSKKGCLSYDTTKMPYTCACDNTNPCKAGYDCQGSVCVRSAADAGQTDVHPAGCAMIPYAFRGVPSWPSAAGSLLALALVVVRRRQDCRKGDNLRLRGDP